MLIQVWTEDAPFLNECHELCLVFCIYFKTVIDIVTIMDVTLQTLLLSLWSSELWHQDGDSRLLWNIVSIYEAPSCHNPEYHNVKTYYYWNWKLIISLSPFSLVHTKLCPALHSYVFSAAFFTWMMNQKGSERNWLWPIKALSLHFLEGLRRTTKYQGVAGLEAE
jgi:hypothetical protein